MSEENNGTAWGYMRRLAGAMVGAPPPIDIPPEFPENPAHADKNRQVAANGQGAAADEAMLQDAAQPGGRLHMPEGQAADVGQGFLGNLANVFRNVPGVNRIAGEQAGVQIADGVGEAVDAAEEQVAPGPGPANLQPDAGRIAAQEGEALSRNGIAMTQEPIQTGPLAPQPGRTAGQAANRDFER